MIRAIVSSVVCATLVACSGTADRSTRPARFVDDLPPDRPGPAVSAPTLAAPSRRVRSAPPAHASAVPRAPTFAGRPIDLDLKDADLHNVFRLLADVGGVSIVVGDDVTGRVTLRLRDVPWDQALDAIARTEHLRVERAGRRLYLITRL